MFASGIRSELEPGLPDGMKCDQRGNVWVTAPGGVWVYSPAGELLGKVRVPEMVANLAWGGPDFRTLYLTATHSVYAIPVKAGPRHEPYMSGRPATGPGTRPPRLPHLNLAGGDMQLDPAALRDDHPGSAERRHHGGRRVRRFRRAGHARQQRVVDNVRRLAEAARARGVVIIHVWFIVEPGAPGVTLNAPLFEGLVDSNAMVRGSWGAAPVSGLEPRAGDFVVEKMRMSAWEGTRLETILKATGRDMIINTGAWTNMSVEHTARTGADKGYFMVVPEDCCSTMNADWHNASINFAMQNVAVVTTPKR